MRLKKRVRTFPKVMTKDKLKKDFFYQQFTFKIFGS